MKKNVLIFPCGSEIGLELHRSLSTSNHFNLIGASSCDNHGKFVYDNYIYGVPHVEDNNFISELNKIITEYKVDFIFPAHDSVVLKLAHNREALNCVVVTSDFETCEITRSKSKTYKTLHNVIKTPQIYNYNNDFKHQFPVFIKPDIGQGSKGCLKINSQEELQQALTKENSLLILEYLPGKEYTVDCFTNRHGELIYVYGRERTRISNGISVNSKNINNENFYKIAQKINSCLKFRGVWFFQLKEDRYGELSLLEIAPRVAGTMALSRANGVNLPLMSLFDLLDMDLEILPNNYMLEIDRALKNKFHLDIKYDYIYVDFDDCLIFDKKINTHLVLFLYKSINDGKKIILISKHNGNLKKALKNYRLTDIFDKIIHLKKEDKKYKYILNKDAIYIDDSFSERKEIKDKLGLCVFSPDMIECLL
jgi:predicted ATP-grasp superfamily ATP-dependent carboligase